MNPEEICLCAAKDRICSIAAGKDEIFVAASDGKGIVTARGKASDFLSIISDPDIAKTGYSLKEIWKKLHSEGLEMNGKLMDIELMDYIINPEKSHQADVLSMTVLGVSLEEKKEDVSELSLFDNPDDAPDKSREAAIYLALGKEVGKTVRRRLWKVFTTRWKNL